MPFADPSLCLNCRKSIEVGSGECPHCGTDLNSHAIQQAWRALVVADQWIAQAGRPATPDLGDRTREADVSRSPRKLSAGTVLLVLGAVSLLVAGGIFVTVSWGSLGIVGRALALLAFTAVVGVLAMAMTRRRLRASAEALWAVFLGLLTLDWFAAHDQGLAGLDALPNGYVGAIWGAVILAASVGIIRAGRRALDRELVIPAAAAGLAPGVGAGMLGDELFDSGFWALGLAALLTGGVALVLRKTKVGFWAATGLAGVFALGAVIEAVVEAIDHPSARDLFIDGHGWPALVVVLVAGAVGTAIAKIRPGAAAVSALGVVLLVTLPAGEAWPDRGGYLASAAAALILALAGTGGGAWRRGLRWATVVAAGILAIGSTPWVANLVDVAGSAAFGPDSDRLTEPVDRTFELSPGPWWVALAVGAALTLILLTARRWPVPAPVLAHLRPAALAVALTAAACAVATFAVPAVVVAGLFLVAGGALAISGPRPWPWIGAAVVALAPVATFSSWPASVFAWPIAALVLVFVAVRSSDRSLLVGSWAVATFWACMTPGAVMQWAGRGDQWTSIAVIVAAVAGLAVALRAKDEDVHVGSEIAAGLVGAFGLLIGSGALPWTVAGTGVALLGLIGHARRIYLPIGSALLGIAYVIRLYDAGVDVVEAYTAPFAALLLAVGVWALRHSSTLSTLRGLGAGVTLALLPSLPQALDEPTSLRALLLGLVAAALLVVGLSRKWKVPFVAGAIVLLALVIANFGPWALAVPRWILIAVLGALAIAVGATWENRVREGRAAVRYLDTMR